MDYNFYSALVSVRREREAWKTRTNKNVFLIDCCNFWRVRKYGKYVCLASRFFFWGERWGLKQCDNGRNIVKSGLWVKRKDLNVSNYSKIKYGNVSNGYDMLLPGKF